MTLLFLLFCPKVPHKPGNGIFVQPSIFQTLIHNLLIVHKLLVRAVKIHAIRSGSHRKDRTGIACLIQI